MEEDGRGRASRNKNQKKSAGLSYRRQPRRGQDFKVGFQIFSAVQARARGALTAFSPRHHIEAGKQGPSFGASASDAIELVSAQQL